MAQPDDLVLYAFHASVKDSASAEHLGYAWDNGWKVGDVVYSHAANHAGWSAKVRERLAIPGARVARPVIATNGRFTVGGWKATQFIPGHLARRIDETAQLAQRVERAMEEAGVTVPVDRQDIFARAERAAWEETGELYHPVSQQLVAGHADLLGTTIYEGLNPPAVVDLVPTAAPRPRGYTCALVVVDGLINGAVDEAICDRFSYIADFDQLLLRAAAYRRHVNNLHPAATTETRAQIHSVEDKLAARISATL
ncbi:hypothetical protein CPHO_09450 [Corynebacterium phocae]|uniref:TIGR02569 family protein n=1 Tax=Corynebacterium phocae TaxID=161895 RepID=A0A1L7D565_9CORY|nr:hypothetical protein [Corynebacterium phocae]APT93072.1 hypothetical protein CPHO_09450 [Corynebacterium phocae]KAA8722373.1 hypothetical protein F4V58_08920 [Corynebacterium phocae]